MDICQCVPYAKKCDVIERKQKKPNECEDGGIMYMRKGKVRKKEKKGKLWGCRRVVKRKKNGKGKDNWVVLRDWYHI